MLIVTHEGDRRCKLRASQRAMVALVYPREHTTRAKTAAGFGISESTAHACTKVLREHGRTGSATAGPPTPTNTADTA